MIGTGDDKVHVAEPQYVGSSGKLTKVDIIEGFPAEGFPIDHLESNGNLFSDEKGSPIRRTNGVIGTAVLLFAIMANLAILPFAVSQMGYLGASVFLVYASFTSYYNGYLLMAMLADPAHHHLTTLSSVGRQAFGYYGGKCTLALQLLLFVLAVIPLYLLLAQQTQALTGVLCVMDWMYVYLAVFIVCQIAPLLREFKVMSVIACFAGLTTMTLVIINSVLDRNGNEFCTASEITHVGQTGSSILQGISIFSLAFSSASAFPEIVREMKEPSKAVTAWNLNFAFAVACYIVTGFVGYSTYGVMVNPMIFLPPMSDNAVAKIGQILQIYSTLLATNLMINIVVVKIEMALGISPESWIRPLKLGMIPPFLSRFIIRSVYILIGWTICCMFPFFSAIQGIIGALTCAPLALFLPACYHAGVYHARYKWYNWVLLVFFVLSGVGLTIAGTYVSVQALIDEAKQGGFKPFNIACDVSDSYTCSSTIA